MVNKILVPIDGSEQSDVALMKALEIAEKEDAELVLFHVAEREPIPYMDYPFRLNTINWLRGITGYNNPRMYPTWAADFNKRYKEHAENYFSKALEKVNETKNKEIKTSLEIVEGNPVDRILDKVEDEDFDLIVMGSTGLGSIERFIVGSVSKGVKSQSNIPVKLYNSEGNEVES